MTYEVFEKFFRQFIRAGYIFGICLLIASLPHSKYGLSVSQFFLTGAFVLERFDLKRFRDKYPAEKRSRFYLLLIPQILYSIAESIYKGFKLFFRNKPALIFSSIFIMHVIGLVFTTDFDYAFKDLRTKLPVFLLPLFISTSGAFGKKTFYLILVLFSASVVARTLINSWYLFSGNYVDIRDISKPVSHIILALLISMTLFILAYFLVRKRWYPTWTKALSLVTIVWLIIYLVITRSATGISVTGITLFILFCIMIFRSRNSRIKLALAFLLILASGSAILYFMKVQKDFYAVRPVDIHHLDKFTKLGNPYSHNLQSGITENGNLVNIYIQWDELRASWNKRSRINFDSLDKRNQPVKFTILRFLTSKDYRKDAEGVSKLSDREVEAIEKGIANEIFLKKFSIRGMIYELLGGYEAYIRTGNPTGNSLMQRLEFWRASVRLIRANWLTGVGTGDMNLAFQQEYEKMHTKLAPDQRWRSHNQFLSICVGFGIFGLAWFLLALLYPPARLNKYADFFFLVFFIIAMLSMIPEDTIESQAGVTFFAFFYSFFLFGRKEDDIIRAG